MEYGPEYPSISPEIHVIDIESGAQAKQEVLSLIEKIEQRGGGRGSGSNAMQEGRRTLQVWSICRWPWEPLLVH